MVAEDFQQLADTPVPPHRVKGWTATLDGKVIGIGGIAYGPNCVMGWTHLTEEVRGYPLFLHKTTRDFLRQCGKEGVRTIIAFEEPGVEAAARWMKRLGFVYHGEYDGQGMWIWHRSRSSGQS